MKKKFSLKDLLFNPEKVSKIAGEIKKVYPAFNQKLFIAATLKKFPQLELKARISWIRENLKNFLPDDYRRAVTILLKALPAPNDNTKTDNDFGDFIYAPYTDFVAQYGQSKNDVAFSLNAIREMTQRFSAEDSIRYFINHHPELTLKELLKWSRDKHYHVRRLASEGTRPKLPWAQKINLPVQKALPILNQLFYDPTRYVTRSVANHLNDISKVHPDLVLQTLARWKKSKKQNTAEMNYIVSHSLRTLIKDGNLKAVAMLNFSVNPQISVSNLNLSPQVVPIGNYLEFEFVVSAHQNERLHLGYTVYFQNKAGLMNSKKFFQIKKLEVKKNQKMVVRKRHRFLKEMTTRKVYPGKHKIEININGLKMAEKEFSIK